MRILAGVFCAASFVAAVLAVAPPDMPNVDRALGFFAITLALIAIALALLGGR
jgi:hypothetical protein